MKYTIKIYDQQEIPTIDVLVMSDTDEVLKTTILKASDATSEIIEQTAIALYAEYQAEKLIKTEQIRIANEALSNKIEDLKEEFTTPKTI